MNKYMDSIYQQQLLNLLPPAILVSVAAYLVRFFGKAIADQVPYADSRDWAIELYGLWFVIEFLLPSGIIAVTLLAYFRDTILAWFNQISDIFNPITYHWINLVIIFSIWVYYAFASQILVREKYKLPVTNVGLAKLNIPVDKRKRTFNLVVGANAVLLQPSALVLIFISGVEAISSNILWTTIFAVQVFVALVGLAFNYSLMRYHLPEVNIHFANKRRPLKDVTLLKMNPDNIRVRNNERILVINKSFVSEIEMIDAKQEQVVKRQMVPFIVWIPWLLALYSFWLGRLFLGIFVGVIIPIILVVDGLLLFRTTMSAKKATLGKKLSSGDGLMKYARSLPWLTKAAAVVSVFGLIAYVLGANGAWNHNLGQLIIFGIIIPFITWALWQIIGVGSDDLR